jgi:hypothetical protein
MPPYKFTPSFASFACIVAGTVAAWVAVEAGSVGWGIALFFLGGFLSPFFMRIEPPAPEPEPTPEEVAWYEEYARDLGLVED